MGSIQFELADGKLNCQIQTNMLASVAQELRDQILNYLEQHTEWKEMRLNLTQVNKVDSIGINLIVSLFKTVQASEKKFLVVGCNASVLKVLKLFRLQNHFPIEGV